MQKFFIETNQIEDEKIIIVGSDVKHISNVLRMRLGEEILIGDKETKYGDFSIKYDEETSTETISINNYLKGNAPLDDGLTIKVGNVTNSEINIENSSIRKISVPVSIM